MHYRQYESVCLVFVSHSIVVRIERVGKIKSPKRSERRSFVKLLWFHFNLLTYAFEATDRPNDDEIKFLIKRIKSSGQAMSDFFHCSIRHNSSSDYQLWTKFITKAKLFICIKISTGGVVNHIYRRCLLDNRAQSFLVDIFFSMFSCCFFFSCMMIVPLKLE